VGELRTWKRTTWLVKGYDNVAMEIWWWKCFLDGKWQWRRNMYSMKLLGFNILVQNQCCSLANCGKMLKPTKSQMYTKYHKSLHVVKIEAEAGDRNGETEWGLVTSRKKQIKQISCIIHFHIYICSNSKKLTYKVTSSYQTYFSVWWSYIWSQFM
jgi:hypothetical protein